MPTSSPISATLYLIYATDILSSLRVVAPPPLVLFLHELSAARCRSRQPSPLPHGYFVGPHLLRSLTGSVPLHHAHPVLTPFLKLPVTLFRPTPTRVILATPPCDPALETTSPLMSPEPRRFKWFSIPFFLFTPRNPRFYGMCTNPPIQFTSRLPFPLFRSTLSLSEVFSAHPR